jgi:hypothetical protein
MEDNGAQPIDPRLKVLLAGSQLSLRRTRPATPQQKIQCDSQTTTAESHRSPTTEERDSAAEQLD